MSLFSEAFMQKAETAKDKTKQGASRVKNSFGRGNNVSPQEEPKKETFTTPEFKRNFFVDRGNSTEAEVKGKRRETKENSEWVQFSEKTRGEFTSYLDNYAKKLDVIMKNRDIDGREILKAQPYAEQIHDMLSRGDVQFDGTNEDNAKLKANIKQMLDKPSGWVLTKTLIEHETAMGLMAFGLVVSAEPKDDARFPRIRRALGFRDTSGSENPHDLLRDKANVPASTALGGVLGGVTGGAVGNTLSHIDANTFAALSISGITKEGVFTSLGTLGGAALGGLVGRRMAERHNNGGIPGTNGEFTINVDSFKTLQNGHRGIPEYVKAMWGIDIKDYDVDPMTGRITNVKGQESEANVRSVFKKLTQDITTRESYFDDLGVPNDARHLMPEKRLLTENGMVKSGEYIDQRIHTKYTEMSKGIPPNPNPQIERRNNARRYQEARKLVLSEMTEEMMKGIETKPKDRPIATIEQKIKDRQEGGRVYEDEKKKLANPEEKEKIEKNVSILSQSSEVFPKIKENTKAITDIDAKIVDLQTEYSVTKPEEIKKKISEQLYTDPDAVTKTIRDLNAKRAAELGDVYDNHVVKKGETPEAYTSRIAPLLDGIERKYDALLQPNIENDRKLRQDQAEIERLLLDKKEKEKRRDDLDEQEKKITENFDDVTSWGITSADLKSKSVDELMKQINAYNTTNPVEGWPEENNKHQESLTILLQAIAEAKAENYMSPPGTPPDSDAREKAIQAELNANKRILESINNKDSDQYLSAGIARLEATRDLIKPETQARVFGKVKDILDNTDTFFDSQKIRAKDIYTDAEKNMRGKPSKGYFEMLDVIFDYKKRPDREEYFKKISSAVSVTDLTSSMEQVAREASIDITGIDPTKLAEIFDILRTNKDKISRQNLRKALVGLIDNVQAQALAMS